MTWRWGRRKVLAAAASIATGITGCLHRERLSSPPDPDDIELPDETWPYEGDGWPMYGYDPGDTGYNPESWGPKQEIQGVWAVDLVEPTSRFPGIGEETAGYSSPGSTPAVYDGLVFVGGLGRAGLLAYDAESGGEVWRFEVGNMVRDAPAAADGRVFFNDGDGTAYAVDIASGEGLWSIDDSCLKPKPYGDLLILGSSEAVRAVTVERGVEVWSEEVGDGDAGKEPVIEGERVFYGEEALHALDVRTGEELWSKEFEGTYIMSKSAAAGNLYLVLSDSRILKVDAELGDIVWGAELTNGQDIGNVRTGVSEEYVLVTTGEIHAFDRESGDVVWTQSVRGSPVLQANNPAIADNVLYVNRGHVTAALDLESGEFLWQRAYPSLSNLIVVDGRIYEQPERATLLASESET